MTSLVVLAKIAMFGAFFFSSLSLFAQTNTPSMPLCTEAVSLGQTYIEAKQDIELQRRDSGNITETTFQESLQQLNAQAGPLTLDQCMASNAEQLVFYQCLINESGNVSNCES